MPHKLLNEFIKWHATCFPADRGEPFAMNEPGLRLDVNVRGFDWDRSRDGKLDLQLPVSTFDIV